MAEKKNEIEGIAVPELQMRQKYFMKIGTDQKKLIIQMAIQGASNANIAWEIERVYGIKVTGEAVAYHRKKWQKQINRKVKNELEEAKASEPLAIIANRLARYDEIYRTALGEEDEAVKQMEELEKEYADKGKDKQYFNTKSLLKAKRERALSAMNDAIKNAGTDVLNKEKIVLREREMALRMGDLESQREILEETVESVAGKITTTRKITREQNRIAGILGWDDDEEQE